MTEKQENMFSMFTELCKFLSSRVKIVNSVPAFQRTFEKLRSLVEEIRDFENSLFDFKGSRSEKILDDKLKLASAAALIAEVIYIYADEKDIAGLRDKTDKNENYFKRLNNTNLLLEANELMNLVTGIDRDLYEFGLTPEEKNDFGNKIMIFEESIKDLDEDAIEIPEINGSVYKLIGEAKYIIENRLDKYAHRFKYSEPDFYSQYYSARRITDSGNGSKKEEIENAMKN